MMLRKTQTSTRWTNQPQYRKVTHLARAVTPRAATPGAATVSQIQIQTVQTQAAVAAAAAAVEAAVLPEAVEAALMTRMQPERKKMLKWVITSKVQIKKDLKKAKWKIGDAVEVVGDQKELFGKESESLQESLKDHKELFGKVTGNFSGDKYPVELLAKDGKNIWDQDGNSVTVELPDTCLKKDERKKKKVRGPTHDETAAPVGQDAATPAGQKKREGAYPRRIAEKSV